jgi:hypothetical protein
MLQAVGWMDGYLFRPEALSLKGHGAEYIISSCVSALISYKPLMLSFLKQFSSNQM